MLNISYQRLFNLKVSHNYYKDGLAKGLHLTPTRDTMDLLKNGRMLLKKLQHKTVVLYRSLNENPPVDPPNPFIDLEEDFRFTFALTVENKSEFVNKTNLDTNGAFQSSNILYFINDPAAASDDATSPEDLNFSLLNSIRSSLFTYEFQLSPVPPFPSDVRLTVSPINDDGTLGAPVDVGKDPNGNPISTPLDLSVDSANLGIYSLSIDLRKKKKGRYKIQVEDAANLGVFLKEDDIYIHDELASQNILGIVDIIYKTSGAEVHAYGATEEYNIQFVRNQTFWKYFVVLRDAELELNTYEINDTLVDPLDGTSYAEVEFSNGTPAETTVNGSLARVFISDDPIEFFELPKVNINLRDVSNNAVVIKSLPNASPNVVIKKNESTSNLESEIYVFL